LHTQKPIRKLEDLQDLKIRSTGLSAKIVKALGGVPVAMPQGDTYEALQKGVVEGTFGPIEVLKGWRQAEVIDFTTDCHQVGYTTSMFVVMNLEKWKKLPADVQEIIEKTSKEWISVHGEAWDALDEKGREYTLSLDNKILELPEQESVRWQKAVQPIIDEYMKAAQDKGLPGKAYVEELLRLIGSSAEK
jgi:TRAP-type C4-dicarboxylate transport system substrate-binding protein